jgi:hypothetical protein
MSSGNDQFASAIEIAEKMANDILARRKEARETRAAALDAHPQRLTVTTADFNDVRASQPTHYENRRVPAGHGRFVV